MDSMYRKHLNELRALEAEASEDSDCPLEEKGHFNPDEIDSSLFYSAMPTFSRFVRTIEYIKAEKEKNTDLKVEKGFANFVVTPEEISHHFNRMGTQHINTYRKEYRDPKEEALEFVKQQTAKKATTSAAATKAIDNANLSKKVINNANLSTKVRNNGNFTISKAIENTILQALAQITHPVDACERVEQLAESSDSSKSWEVVTDPSEEEIVEENVEENSPAPDDDATEGAAALPFNAAATVDRIVNAMAETEREYREELKKRAACERLQTLKMPFCAEDIADMQSNNPSTRAQWILNSFFHLNREIRPQKEPPRLNILQNPEARVQELKEANKKERKSFLEQPMAEISRIGKPCPITACKGGVGMTSMLAHLLMDHTVGIVVEVRETFAGNIHRIMFNPRDLKFRETVCLGALIYGGIKNGLPPGQREICRDNKFLPPRFEAWTYYLPVMIMLTKSSWSAYCGSPALDDKLADPKKKDTHIYVIYLLSPQTLKPIYGTVTIFDAKLTQSRSRHIACRGLNKSLNPVDFLSQETDFLVLQQVEMDRFTRNGRYEVGLEVMLNEEETNMKKKKTFK